MSYEMRLDTTRQIVTVIHLSSFKRTTAQKVLPEIVNLLAFKRWHRILIDFTEVEVVDLAAFSSYITENNIHRTLPGSLAMGILVSAEELEGCPCNEKFSDAKFSLRFFSSRDEVLDWLKRY